MALSLADTMADPIDDTKPPSKEAFLEELELFLAELPASCDRELSRPIASTNLLVPKFARALAEKLRRSQKKHQWPEDKSWHSGFPLDALLHEMGVHIEKGDPLDVAAYCAFAWFHGWSTEGVVRSRVQAALLKWRETVLAPIGSGDEGQEAVALAHQLLNDTSTDPDSERALFARVLLRLIEKATPRQMSEAPRDGTMIELHLGDDEWSNGWWEQAKGTAGAWNYIDRRGDALDLTYAPDSCFRGWRPVRGKALKA